MEEYLEKANDNVGLYNVVFCYCETGASGLGDRNRLRSTLEEMGITHTLDFLNDKSAILATMGVLSDSYKERIAESDGIFYIETIFE